VSARFGLANFMADGVDIAIRNSAARSRDHGHGRCFQSHHCQLVALDAHLRRPKVKAFVDWIASETDRSADPA
jgi:hypothetical protein